METVPESLTSPHTPASKRMREQAASVRKSSDYLSSAGGMSQTQHSHAPSAKTQQLMNDIALFEGDLERRETSYVEREKKYLGKIHELDTTIQLEKTRNDRIRWPRLPVSYFPVFSS